MSDSPRETVLVRTFAKLADTLVDEYDVVDLLQMLVETCAETLDVVAAGILLVDNEGRLELVASTSEASRIVELIQLSSDAGPCIESFETGRVVSVASIDRSPPKWKRFRDIAMEEGFRSAHAVPLRLRDSRIGTLNLLGANEGTLNEEDILVAQALADVATIGILQHRAIRDGDDLARQLQGALNSRVVIEQAKGVLSHLHNVSMDKAFALLRDYSRENNLGLAEVAIAIVERRETIPLRSVD